jgi:hypothetical protein
VQERLADTAAETETTVKAPRYVLHSRTAHSPNEDVLRLNRSFDTISAGNADDIERRIAMTKRHN